MSAGRFIFRLQRLLTLRQMAERAAAISLGSAQAVASKAHAAQATFATRRADARGMMLPQPGTERSVAELTRAAFFVDQLDVQVAEAGKTTNAADQQVRDTRERLGERVQARRMLERLRERHLAEWSHVEERHEREVMDGLARRMTGPRIESTTLSNP